MNMMISSMYNINRRTRLGPNILTPNQATGTEALGDTTGFSSVGAGVTLSSSLEQAHTGSKSLKIITNGAVGQQGTGASGISCLSNTLYNFQGYTYAPLGSTLRLRLSNASASMDLTIIGTGGWQKISSLLNTRDTASINFYFQTNTTNQAIAFYMDSLSLRRVVP